MYSFWLISLNFQLPCDSQVMPSGIYVLFKDKPMIFVFKNQLVAVKPTTFKINYLKFSVLKMMP